MDVSTATINSNPAISAGIPPNDLGQMQWFLTELFGKCDPQFVVVLLHYNLRGVPSVLTRISPADLAARPYDNLAATRDIYFKIAVLDPTFDVENPYAIGGQKHVRQVVLIALDIDHSAKGATYPHRDVALTKLATMPTPPTMIVDSGSGGLHAYWLLAEPITIVDAPHEKQIKDAVERFQATVRAMFPGKKVDTGNQGCERFLRLPGTYRGKDGGWVHVIQHVGPRYTLDQLVGCLGARDESYTFAQPDATKTSRNTALRYQLGVEHGWKTPADLLLHIGWTQEGNILTRPSAPGELTTSKSAEDRGDYVKIWSGNCEFQVREYDLVSLYVAWGMQLDKTLADDAYQAAIEHWRGLIELGVPPHVQADFNGFDAVEIVAGRDLPVLRNAVQMGKDVRKLAVVDVHQQLLDVTGDVFFNWHGFLVTRRDAESVFQFKNSVEFFGWLATIFDVRWLSGGSAIPKNEFYEWVLHRAKPIDDIEVSPHFPPVPRVLYLHEPILLGNGYELEKFMALWSPTTPQDKQLILALLMSVFWGGKPGARPFFLIKIAKGKKVGGGKSTLIEAAGRVANRGREGYYTMSQSADSDAVFKRLLTPTARSKRVVLLDNMKTFVLGGQELEAVVTCRTINGHRMYVGDGERDNYLVWTGTTNQTKLSDDLADRAVVIHLNSARAKYGADFEARLNALDYDKLTRDVMALFARRPAAIAAYSRRAAWDRDILSRLDAPDELIKLIAKRSRLNNDTIDQADMLRETIIAQLRLMNKDPDTAKIFIPVQQLTSWVGGFQLGSSRAVNTPKGLRVLVDQLGSKIKELSTAPSRKHGRGYYWTGVHAYANLAYDLSLVFP